MSDFRYKNAFAIKQIIIQASKFDAILVEIGQKQFDTPEQALSKGYFWPTSFTKEQVLYKFDEINSLRDAIGFFLESYIRDFDNQEKNLIPHQSFFSTNGKAFKHFPQTKNNEYYLQDFLEAHLEILQQIKKKLYRIKQNTLFTKLKPNLTEQEINNEFKKRIFELNRIEELRFKIMITVSRIDYYTKREIIFPRDKHLNIENLFQATFSDAQGFQIVKAVKHQIKRLEQIELKLMQQETINEKQMSQDLKKIGGFQYGHFFSSYFGQEQETALVHFSIDIRFDTVSNGQCLGIVPLSNQSSDSMSFVSKSSSDSHLQLSENKDEFDQRTKWKVQLITQDQKPYSRSHYATIEDNKFTFVGLSFQQAIKENLILLITVYEAEQKPKSKDRILGDLSPAKQNWKLVYYTCAKLSSIYLQKQFFKQNKRDQIQKDGIPFRFQKCFWTDDSYLQGVSSENIIKDHFTKTEEEFKHQPSIKIKTEFLTSIERNYKAKESTKIRVRGYQYQMSQVLPQQDQQSHLPSQITETHREIQKLNVQELESGDLDYIYITIHQLKDLKGKAFTKDTFLQVQLFLLKDNKLTKSKLVESDLCINDEDKVSMHETPVQRWQEVTYFNSECKLQLPQDDSNYKICFILSTVSEDKQDPILFYQESLYNVIMDQNKQDELQGTHFYDNQNQSLQDIQNSNKNNVHQSTLVVEFDLFSQVRSPVQEIKFLTENVEDSTRDGTQLLQKLQFSNPDCPNWHNHFLLMYGKIYQKQMLRFVVSDFDLFKFFYEMQFMFTNKMLQGYPQSSLDNFWNEQDIQRNRTMLTKCKLKLEHFVQEMLPSIFENQHKPTSLSQAEHLFSILPSVLKLMFKISNQIGDNEERKQFHKEVCGYLLQIWTKITLHFDPSKQVQLELSNEESALTEIISETNLKRERKLNQLISSFAADEHLDQEMRKIEKIKVQVELNDQQLKEVDLCLERILENFRAQTKEQLARLYILKAQFNKIWWQNFAQIMQTLTQQEFIDQTADFLYQFLKPKYKVENVYQTFLTELKLETWLQDLSDFVQKDILLESQSDEKMKEMQDLKEKIKNKRNDVIKKIEVFQQESSSDSQKAINSDITLQVLNLGNFLDSEQFQTLKTCDSNNEKTLTTQQKLAKLISKRVHSLLSQYKRELKDQAKKTIEAQLLFHFLTANISYLNTLDEQQGGLRNKPNIEMGAKEIWRNQLPELQGIVLLVYLQVGSSSRKGTPEQHHDFPCRTQSENALQVDKVAGSVFI